MPPTIQNAQKARRDRERGKEGFVCVMKYTNFLPDIPFDAKFISYPFEANRFIQYKPTSLERNYRYDLLTEPDLGVTIDLINPETYDVDNSVDLDPADERLLEEELAPQSDQKRQRQHAKTVSWLRKTEYISTEYNRFQTSNEMVEKQIGFTVKKKLQGVDLYKDRAAQLQAIEGSFEAAKKPITRHHTNPRLHPVDVFPVFPDFEFWHMPCAHVIFDTEPTLRGKTTCASEEEMSQGMIRGMEDESGDQFVAYFLPTEDTLKKRRHDPESQEDEQNKENQDVFEYKLAREYNWNVQNKAIKGFEENYFFVFRAGQGVFYNELQTRVRLNKRRGRGGAGGVTSAVSKLIVKTRDPTENEERLQNARMLQLENVAQEEDDDDEDDDESDADEIPTAESQDEQTDKTDNDDERTEDDNEKEDKLKESQDLDEDLFGSSSSEDDDEG